MGLPVEPSMRQSAPLDRNQNHQQHRTQQDDTLYPNARRSAASCLEHESGCERSAHQRGNGGAGQITER